MNGAFCDPPWPGNDAGDDPGLSRSVGGGDTRGTPLKRALNRYSDLSAFCLQFAQVFFRYVCSREKKHSADHEKNMLQSVNFP